MPSQKKLLAVLQEAYDLGVPVLCSRVGGLVEAVRYDV